MEKLIDDEMKKNLEGMYLKYDDNGKIENKKVVGIAYVETAQYGDANGKRYEIKFEGDTEEGKILTTTSKRLMWAIYDKKVVKGDTITITRTGTGFETQYAVEVAGGEKEIVKPEKPGDEQKAPSKESNAGSGDKVSIEDIPF